MNHTNVLIFFHVVYFIFFYFFCSLHLHPLLMNLFTLPTNLDHSSALFISAILIFVWSGITMCRIYSSIYPDRHLANWALGSGHALLNMQGLLNGIIFFSVLYMAYHELYIQYYISFRYLCVM